MQPNGDPDQPGGAATRPRPLEGVRVVEFGEFAAGPFCALLLADWGADVVKVESLNGDRLRQWPPYVDDDGTRWSANFLSLNRNKRSVALDLRSSEGNAHARRLCAAAHVVVENFRPGAMQRLGLGYAELAAEHKDLVFCSVSGYGQSGPYSSRGAFDIAIQAISGLMSVTGDSLGDPAKCGVAVADFMAGVFGALGIMVALRRAEQSGEGAHVDCSMLSCMLSVATIQTSEFWGTGVPPGRLGSAHPQNAPYQAFASADGHFVIAAGTQPLWETLCATLGRSELVADPRFLDQALRATHQVALKELLESNLAEKTSAEWIDILAPQGIPCSPVYDYGQVLSDPHVTASGLIDEMRLSSGKLVKRIGNPVNLSGYSFDAFRPPPALGEHNDDVERDWALDIS
ncbi:MAG: succinate---hydroxymethylglutarate CoA-transferase [Pseudonocardiales bacterium]|jgi:crotonobetainyl-CoA:carnitine CoA-transferase CaiB-like acyl-CoA transferase|nr:succinate---hydroxymethylglutarate CoA-transferase [Pseudonocardiales bacterium]